MRHFQGEFHFSMIAFFSREIVFSVNSPLIVDGLTLKAYGELTGPWFTFYFKECTTSENVSLGLGVIHKPRAFIFLGIFTPSPLVITFTKVHFL